MCGVWKGIWCSYGLLEDRGDVRWDAEGGLGVFFFCETRHEG